MSVARTVDDATNVIIPVHNASPDTDVYTVMTDAASFKISDYDNFRVDGDKIYLRESVGRAPTDYPLTVTAGLLTEQVTLTVNPEPAPTLVLSALSGQTAIITEAAEETLTSAKPLAEVTSNGTLSLSDDHDGVFEIADVGGVWTLRIKAGATLDYEATNTYTFDVIADGAIHGKQNPDGTTWDNRNTESFTLTVTDVVDTLTVAWESSLTIYTKVGTNDTQRTLVGTVTTDALPQNVAIDNNSDFEIDLTDGIKIYIKSNRTVAGDYTVTVSITGTTLSPLEKHSRFRRKTSPHSRCFRLSADLAEQEFTSASDALATVTNDTSNPYLSSDAVFELFDDTDGLTKLRVKQGVTLDFETQPTVTVDVIVAGQTRVAEQNVYADRDQRSRNADCGACSRTKSVQGFACHQGGHRDDGRRFIHDQGGWRRSDEL